MSAIPHTSSRPRTVRARMATLLLVPLLALLGLWGHTVATAAQQLGAERQQQRAETELRAPALATARALQHERRAVAGQLGRPDAKAVRTLEAAAERTRQAARELGPADGRLPAQLLRGLEKLRERIADRRADWPEAYAGYTAAVEAALHAADAPAARGAVPELDWAGEQLARQDALLLAAHRSGTFAAEQHREFTAAAAARRALESVAAAGLAGPALERWDELARGGGQQAVAAVEARVRDAAPGAPAARAATAGRVGWLSGYPQLRDGLREVQAAGVRADGGGLRSALLSPSGLAALLGLAAIGATVAVSVRTGRALLAELAALRVGALDIARRKLPRALRRIRSGGPVDIAAEAPEHPASDDEFGQVHQALGVVHRAALRAAADRAELSDGISGAFVNLARRSQSLVNRQLELLDEMERETQDPGALEELFRLDHLSTRMRRQAESLIILSGADPGRSWSGPVPMTSVLQAAVCEIEDYRRIELRRLPDLALAGHAVADLTHLLAELLENAAGFSPPHTWVKVTGSHTEDGYLCEIEDAGAGLEPAGVEHANRRIRRSDPLDLGATDRLGLFVVGRLADRHGITVRLRGNDGDGVTATVLVPAALLSAQPADWSGAPDQVTGMAGMPSSA